MDCKLIALDLDETTLSTDKSITEKNKSTITQALSSGIKVVLCSGRTFDGMIDIANELGISGPKQYIITNGGDIIENLAGKVIFKKILTKEDCSITTKFLTQNKVNFVLIDTNNDTFPSYHAWLDSDSKNDVVKVLMHIEKNKIISVSKLIHQQFDADYFVVKTGAEYLEIFPKDINKGLSVKRLANYLNIDMKQVLAMGDMDNDISMIKLSGIGVAMENAEPEVKAVADYITSDNNHSGVGLAIEKFALK